jgi:hypothetical protein
MIRTTQTRYHPPANMIDGAGTNCLLHMQYQLRSVILQSHRDSDWKGRKTDARIQDTQMVHPCQSEAAG